MPQNQVKDAVARLVTGIHRAVFTASGGRVAGNLMRMPVVMLTTTGRKSGKQRTTMLTSPVQELGRLALLNVQVRLPLTDPLQSKLIRLLVTLGPRCSNARTLCPIEHPILDPGRISVYSHSASQGVNFPDDMTLCQSADRWIA